MRYSCGLFPRQFQMLFFPIDKCDPRSRVCFFIKSARGMNLDTDPETPLYY